MTSDVLPYEGVDRVVDGTAMPFADGELRFIGMLNVFHHIPERRRVPVRGPALPGAGWADADRLPAQGLHAARRSCAHAHHEPYRPDAERWQFDSTGPLSGANGALAWIVFQRDAQRFRAWSTPTWTLVGYTPHTPLRYWLAGLKDWSLLGRRRGAFVREFDRRLSAILPAAGSFVDIEVLKRPG